MNPTRLWWLPLTMACVPGAAWAQEPADPGRRALEQRIRELEEKLRRLEERLQQQQGAVPAAAPKQAQPAKQPDEWDEPEIAKEAVARDEEARRRLVELETWKRKFEGERIKLQEEEAEKVKFDWSGKYKLRFNRRDNLNLDNRLQQWRFDNEAYFDQRFQLRLDATYGALSSVLLLDKGNFVFDWKEDSEGTLDRWGEFHSVSAPLVRELYAQYTGDFIARVGRSSWDIGHSIVLEGPMDSIRLSVPVGDPFWGRTMLDLGYTAVAGGWRDYNDFRQTGPPAGTREAVFSATNKLDGWYGAVDIRPSRDIKLTPYALYVADRGDSVDADLNLDKDFSRATKPRDGGFEPLWLGAPVTLKLGRVTLDGEMVLLRGTVSRTQDLRAQATFLEANYDLGAVGSIPKWTLGVKAARGSGNAVEDDLSTGATVRDFAALFTCRDRHKFGNIFSEDLRAGYFLWDSNLANLTYVQPHTSLKLSDSFGVTLAGSWIRSTRPVLEGRGPVGDWSRGAATSTRTTHDVGWELDVNLDYTPMKRIDVFLNLGYFHPGEAYRRPSGREADPAVEVSLGSEFKF